MKLKLAMVVLVSIGLRELYLGLVRPQIIMQSNRFSAFKLLKPQKYYRLQRVFRIVNSLVLVSVGVAIIYLKLNTIFITIIPLLHQFIEFICRYISIEKGYAKIISS